MTLRIIPITLKQADAFVITHHRHHPPAFRHRWSIGVESEGHLRGVAITGRPKSRHLDDGFTLEIVRVATDGTANACSKLYAAVARAARAMGYTDLLTYTLEYESGASLRAVGWHTDRQVRGESWNRNQRPRTDLHPTTDKVRWRCQLVPRDSGPGDPVSAAAASVAAAPSPGEMRIA